MLSDLSRSFFRPSVFIIFLVARCWRLLLLFPLLRVSVVEFASSQSAFPPASVPLVKRENTSVLWTRLIGFDMPSALFVLLPKSDLTDMAFKRPRGGARVLPRARAAFRFRVALTMRYQRDIVVEAMRIILRWFRDLMISTLSQLELVVSARTVMAMPFLVSPLSSVN